MATIEERVSDDGSKTFRVKVRLKGQPAQSATFTRRTEAKRWAETIEAEMRAGRHFPTATAKKRTLADLLDRYEAEILPTKKRPGNQRTHVNWWRAELGHLLLKDVTPAVIGEARDRLARRAPSSKVTHGTPRAKPSTEPKAPKAKAKGKAPPTGPTLSGPTVNRYLALLSHAFSVAVKEWGWLEDSPMRRVRKKPEARGRVRFLADDERARLLEACAEGPAWLHPVVLLAMSTGMRHGEILALRWADVDFGRKAIVVHESKNGERRAVPLMGAALATMREWSKVRRLDDDRVFPETKGFHHRWWEALARAKVEDLRFHDLRHTAASYLAMSGATLGDIAGVLGHKTLAMVKRYAHLSETHLSDVVERMNRRYLG